MHNKDPTELLRVHLHRIMTLSTARWAWFDTNSANEAAVEKDPGASWDKIGVLLSDLRAFAVEK